MSNASRRILVTGGAGYVGSALVPKLLARGHEVTVLDIYVFGDDVLAPHRNLKEVNADIRDLTAVEGAVAGCDTVIHLACISNDPCFELDPSLGKSINFDAFSPLVRASRKAGVERFIYASSSSVYGIRMEANVNEEMEPRPLTDYSKYKLLCEEILMRERAPGFAAVVIRPATVCGYARRQRLDVIVNILTNHAVNTGTIKVFGGTQLRPNIHMADMTDLYLRLLELDPTQIDGRVWNVCRANHSVDHLADIVKTVVGKGVNIEHVPTDDNRSYHVSAQRIADDIGFVATHSIEDAVEELARAIRQGQLPNSMADPRYFNIKTMQSVGLK